MSIPKSNFIYKSLIYNKLQIFMLAIIPKNKDDFHKMNKYNL